MFRKASIFSKFFFISMQEKNQKVFVKSDKSVFVCERLAHHSQSNYATKMKEDVTPKQKKHQK